MTIFTISTQTQLDSTISQLKGGDTVQFAAGTYSLTFNYKAFASEVTITSADPANPAKLSAVRLVNSSNVTFRNLEIGRPLSSTETVETSLARVVGGGGITFDVVHFHGSLDGNPANDGVGISTAGVDGIKITNSEFQQLGRGVIFGTSKNIALTNNRFHDMRSDGADFGAVNNVLVEGNTFTDFYRVTADHPDAIQFWTANTTTPNTDIVIRNNVILQGKGAGMQGIFMNDEVGTLPYERVTIENNLVYEQDMPNGITVMGGKDVAIRGNTVLSPTGDAGVVAIRADRIQGGTITKNLTDKIYSYYNSSTFAITDNLLTSQSGLSSATLSLSGISAVTASQLIVNGYGYQLPVSSAPITATTATPAATSNTTTTSGMSSGSTATMLSTSSTGSGATTTKPTKSKGCKGALGEKIAVTSSRTDAGEYSFAVGTLSDTLPELPSSSVETSGKSSFDLDFGGLSQARKASRFAVEALAKPSLDSFGYRSLVAAR